MTLLLLCFNDAFAVNNFRARINQSQENVFNTEDVKTEIELGRDIAARILGRYSILDNTSISRYVSLVGKALAFHSSRTEIEYHFVVLDAETINAYSTPGGYIFITSGALSMMQDESELAAVLAHEIAHITERHIVNELGIRASDGSVTAGLGRLIGGAGDSAGIAFSQAIDKAVTILFERGYQQKDELDSDRISTLMLASIGYDALALERYLKRVESLKGDSATAINTTHPPSQQRLESLASLIQQEELDELQNATVKERFTRHVNF